MTLSAPSRAAGITFAVLAAFGFSFKAIFVKLAYQSAPVDAVTLLALRMSMSLPFILLMAIPILRQGPALTRKDYGWLFLLGVVGYYGSSMLDFMGLQYISAGLERLILFTYPMLTILLGVAFLGKKFERKVLLAMALAYAGIIFAFMHDVSVSSEIGTVITGGLLVFGCAVLYAGYSAGSEAAIARLGAMKFSVLALLVSTLATLVHFLFTHRLTALNLPLPVYGWCLAMALFSTVLPIFWQSAAVFRIGAARAVMIGLLGPVLTIFFSWWLLKEPISLEQMVGTVLVIGGLLVVIRR
ncbi:DMT family transporter (plasmid) [Erwinia sp. INIA-01]|uniref:DMT family transporter n=1 Tax=Erwinia sp. INIA01 TaxID=2991500 RepID=UPI00222571AD|nr:DMT family transporter [Erwinia sp. INIA01]MCW1873127.1 DMT family transporter [Erwinia sp. INIA01]